MYISIIAALFGPQNIIGINGTQPLFIKEDLKRFREKTIGKPAIMGRKTYESIRRDWEARYGKEKEMLPQRLKVVITSGDPQLFCGTIVARSLEEAFQLLHNGNFAREHDEVVIIGGAEIYKAALPYAQKLYLTKVPNYEGAGDVFFPAFEDHFYALPAETSGDPLPFLDGPTGLSVEYHTYLRK